MILWFTYEDRKTSTLQIQNEETGCSLAIITSKQLQSQLQTYPNLLVTTSFSQPISGGHTPR